MKTSVRISISVIMLLCSITLYAEHRFFPANSIRCANVTTERTNAITFFDVFITTIPFKNVKLYIYKYSIKIFFVNIFYKFVYILILQI
jgi:hypothetical protein